MTSPTLSRREFCLTLGAIVAGAACSDSTAPFTPDPRIPRLGVRPRGPSETITPGLYRLNTGDRSSLLLVPEGYRPNTALPLVVALHGAGSTAQGPIDFLGSYAESNRFIVLAPESAGGTWDGVEGIYGPDLTTIDAALRLTFARCAVDATRICLEGFSDGASYALGVGITNPEIFTSVVAFSPGFVTNAEHQGGKPRIFVSHGTRDGVLSIDTTSRVIVPALRADGYDVTYVEFDGTHMIPTAIASAAVQFILTAQL
jgi:predicted esterase